MPKEALTDQQAENLRTVYRELCTSYRAIDDFRMRLLGLLPLATGGIFLLVGVGEEQKVKLGMQFLQPVGAFGFLVTLGLFCFELYGIKKCHKLIKAGIRLEEELSIVDGQFKTRPPGVAFLMDELLAAGVIYPAVLAAWAFLTLVSRESAGAAHRWAIRVLISGFAVSLLFSLRLKFEDKISKMIAHVKN